MATEAKTTWERLLEETQLNFPEMRLLPDCEQIDPTSFAVHFLCGELEKAQKRIADLDAQLREAATVKR